MKLILLTLALLASIANAFSQETMTLDHFRELVAAPGDTVPLIPQLSSIPIWTNAVVSNVMTYASGKVVTEQIPQTVRTIGGKYIVHTTISQFYHRPMNAILTFDEKNSSLKLYGYFTSPQGEDVITEGTVAYDFNNKTFSANSTFGDFKETTTGSYTDTQSKSKSITYLNGAVFLTRETTTTSVLAK